MTNSNKSTSTLILEFIKKIFLTPKYKMQLVPVRAKTIKIGSAIKQQSNR